MAGQYFSIGEQVILCSLELPHLNGEYEVEGVLPRGIHICPFSGGKIYAKSDFVYRLVGIGAHPPRKNPPWFAQGSLRKKHKPSDDSYESMMANLKNKVES